MIEGAVKSRSRSRRSPTLRRETWRIARQLRLPIRGSKAPPQAGGKSPPLSTLPGFIPYLERHRDTTYRRIAGAARRSVRSGRSLLVGVRCRRARPDRLLREGTTRTYAGCGFSSGGDMAGVAAVADPRRMSSSRATRTASSASSCSTAGALGLLGPLLDLLPRLEPPEVRGRRLCRRPPAAVRHDQAVFARRVSVATLRAPDRAVRPSPLTDRRRGRRERAPPRPSAPPTGSRQSTAQRETRGNRSADWQEPDLFTTEIRAASGSLR